MLKLSLIIKTIESIVKELITLLERRGKRYGTNMLITMGPAYPLTLLVAKALRIWHIWTTTQEIDEEEIGDLVNYGLLLLALKKLEEGENG